MDYDYEHFDRYKALEVPRFSMHWWSNRYYSRLLQKYVKAGKILEIGCGTGFFLAELARYYNTCGIDVSDFALDRARNNCPNADIRKMPAEDMADFPSESFAAIVSRHVFEHLADPGAALKECYRVLEPGGILLFTVPNMASIGRRWKGLKWYGYQEKTHISMLDPAEWIDLTGKSGLRVQKAFSDGLWDAPYVPLLPALLQKCIFGILGGIQAVLALSFLPIPLGEALIVLARKPYEKRAARWVKNRTG
jgi:SAM-dependent methyltransferase